MAKKKQYDRCQRPECKKKIEPGTHGRMYCSNYCRNTHWVVRYRPPLRERGPIETY